MDLALNNLERLICHKTQETNQTTKNTLKRKTSFFHMSELTFLQCKIAKKKNPNVEIL